MNDGTFLYSFSRIFVVIGKPLSLIILSTFYLEEQANKLALFFLVGSLSCVFFSFNTYKIIIPGINNKATSLKFKSVQNIQILLSSFFIFCIGSIFYLFEFKNIFSLCLISSLEFYFHEKQRNYLYQGNFLNFSLILLFSYIFILSLSLLLIFSRFEFFISLIFLLIFYIFLLGRVLSSPESSNNFKYLFKIIFNEGISFLLPILSRLTMSLDRMMISLFYPSNLWQITVLSQYFFAFVFIYDLFNLGPQKYKILKKAKTFGDKYKK